MSAVVDIPMQLALVLMLALGQPVAEQREPVTVPVAASFAPANPLAFTATSWRDAMAAMRGDKRFARYASRVFHTSAGEAYVPVERERREIDALKADTVIARHVAEQFARANTLALGRALGRAPVAVDLYLAHIAGPRVAVQFRQQLARTPKASVATALPDLAEVVPELAFDGDEALTLAQVATLLDARVGRAVRGVRSADAAATRVLGWSAEVRPQR